LPPIKRETPKGLRVYEAMGIEAEIRGTEASATCPFCGKEDKFSIHTESSKWQCFSCQTRGNQYTFIREIYDLSKKNYPDWSQIAEERGFLFAESVKSTGAVLSCINDRWLVPGYSADQKLVQLYRWMKMWDPGESRSYMKLVPLPDLPQGIHFVGPWDENAKTVYVTEGLWDGGVFYETISKKKSSGKHQAFNVVAVPGCNVFFESWGPLFKNKEVIFLYDSDHPKINKKTQEEMPPAGLSGMQRVVKMLRTSGLTAGKNGPKNLRYLHWGEEGYDPDLPSGYDLRDRLREYSTLEGRIKALDDLLDNVEDVPEEEWIEKSEELDDSKPKLTPLECNSFEAVLEAWSKAMKWTRGLQKGLVAMLCSVASTMQLGDQIWIRIVGPAACGKSTLCEAVTVSKYVIAKSTMRGFHSGYVAADGKDKSLAMLAKGKTLITKDGDTLLQAPNLPQILSEGRDLYDRVSRTSYRHGGDKNYEGHSMTWILCGTSSLRAIDRSELGERFIDCVIMEQIDDELEDLILERVVEKAIDNIDIRMEENDPDKFQDPNLTEAMRLTGGYADYLRENSDRLYAKVEVNDQVRRTLTRLGKMVAYMRARPSERQDETAERELASRLTAVFARVAKSVAVVLNKEDVDDEVMEYVREYAFDTARGKTMHIVEFLYGEDDGALTQAVLMCPKIGGNEEHVKKLLRFLKQIGVVELFSRAEGGVRSQPKWRLTDTFHNLMSEVL